MLVFDTQLLKNKRNLLAFSAGVDSSALFFLLLEHEIDFDIAIVNYATRPNSDREERHAYALASKYNLHCHSIKAPSFSKDFEKQARDFRYGFFDALMTTEGYDTLLTAHQLNDQLEWLLMRLSKGAGVSELIGLDPISVRNDYYLVRPLLSCTKEGLLAYLDKHAHPYYVDESNFSQKYERNRVRKKFANTFMSEYAEGITRSFHYLRKDKENLAKGYIEVYAEKSLRIIRLYDRTFKSKAIDISLKSMGYLLSASQRIEIEKTKSVVIADTWAIEMEDDLVYIAPYIKGIMPKIFKEICRKAHIPAKIRPYLFQENIKPQAMI